MAEQSTSDASTNEISLNIKGPSELKLSITIALSKTVLELKQAIAEKSDVPADRQRLIYSGRVLKDEDALSTYKVQNAHTVHMVKGAPKPNASSSTPAPAQPLPSMQTGQTSTETLLNGPRGHGALAGLNMQDLFGGANPNDPNMMQNMLSNPQFLSQMSQLMSDPALLDTMFAQHPQLAANPQLRQAFQTPEFRQMMSNPDTLRNMMQMTAALNQAGIDPMMAAGMSPFGGMGGLAGLGGFGGLGGAGSPPAGTGAPPPASGNLFAQAATGATAASTPGVNPPGAGAAAGTNPLAPGAFPPSPFGMVDPALIQQLLGGQGGFGSPGAAGNPFAALGGFGVPPPAQPADTRPVEERFQVQLQQMQEMGLTNAQQNVRALLATGGNVHAAVEYIFSGGGV